MGRKREYIRIRIENIENTIALAMLNDTIGYRSEFLLRYFKGVVNKDKIDKQFQIYREITKKE